VTPAFFEPVAFPFYVYCSTMVEDPIENSGGNHMISEDVTPFAKGFIGCKNGGRSFISSRYKLEKAMSTRIIKGEISRKRANFDVN